MSEVKRQKQNPFLRPSASATLAIAQSSEKRRLVLKLPPEVCKRLRVRAAEQGISQAELVMRLLAQSENV